MRRVLLRILTALLLALPALASTVPALAATPDDAVDDLADQGYYVEPGAAPADENQLSGVISSARNAGIRLMVAILDEDPAGGPTSFADAILDRVGEGTVLVMTRSLDVGVASTEFSQAESEAALDAADARGGDDVEYAATFASALTGADVPVTTAGSTTGGDGGGGSGGLIVLLVIVAVLIGIVVFVVRRQNKRTRERAAQDLETARTEIRKQLDAMANDILDLADTTAGSEEAQRLFEEASATYAATFEEFERADTLADFTQLAIRLDLATWQLDAAEALVAGKPVPPKPEKRETARCFFDPAHRGPLEEAEIRTAAGSKKVRVCTADAAKLRRGESPQPRMVQVGGRQVPAPVAPRSHGGGGFDFMDAFSILVGGMASGIPQQWGSRRTSRGGFGGFMGPGPSRSSRSTVPSRSSSGTGRSSTSRSRSGSGGTTRSRTGRRRRR